ncbi:MAG: helicase-exonuclease AddAB subunit AddA [Firmicutes bacterium]|nr:helicase-exonuclease AddAB subunit AddA [Bacillota bacterium]
MGISESGRKWTEQQAAAIGSRGCSLLVAAAAGSGKTATLVERVIQRITDPVSPVNIDQMLVVTFTNAAAAEMRERIARAIGIELDKDPASHQALRQLALLPRAPIMTIHSFCLEVLRQHFYLLELDPGFRVADATETNLLQTEALDELFEGLYESGDEEFIRLVDHYGGERDDHTLRDLVLRLYSFSHSHPEPLRWLDEAGGFFGEGAGIDHFPWGREIREDILVELSGAREALAEALNLTRLPNGPGVYAPLLEAEVSALGEAMAACRESWESTHQAITGLGFARLAAAKQVDPVLRQRVQKLRGDAKERVADLRETFFSRTESEWLEDLTRVRPLMEGLVKLVKGFAGIFQGLKSSRNLVDFNDLEHLCLQVLRRTDGYRERFVEVLVDEYQDINPVQEAILELVSRADNRFMVGDVKQSIYRFRLAEPGLFLKKYREYPVGAGRRERRIDLRENFRSRLEIIQGVNFLFKRVMTPYHGEMAYDEDARLVCGADYPPASGEEARGVELRLIELGTGAGGVSAHEAGEDEPGPAEVDDQYNPEGSEAAAVDLEDLDTAQVEARWIAGRIKEMMGDGPGGGFQVFDRGERSHRPLSYRDVVILMRSTKGWADTFSEEMQQAGVPVYTDLGSGYFDATEVETVLSLLMIIDNPRQDIPLAGVLRAPWNGLSAEELARVRLRQPKGSFYDALLASINREQDESPADKRPIGPSEELAARLERFVEQLERWRGMARQGSLTDLIRDIYQETGYYHYVGGMPGGSQRQANLRALQSRARQYEATSFRGLFRFLRFIERLQESGQDLGTARVLGENEDVVRIMSIHKSKGLEFPVVFVAGLGRRFNLRDLNQRLLLHRSMGLGPELVDPERCLHYPTLAKLAIKNRLTRELLAEELRILYVAMTRAEQKLIMLGSLPRLPLDLEGADSYPVDQPLPDHLLASARRPLDWIIPAVVKAKTPAECWSVLAGPPREIFVDAAPRERADGADAAHEDEIEAARGTESPGQSLESLVADRLNWSYPYPGQGLQAAKLTVTEAKNRIRDLETADAVGPVLEVPVEVSREQRGYLHRWERPRFLQETRGLTAAERGTAFHLVMQHLRLDGVLDVEGIRLQMEDMLRREIISAAQLESVDVRAIAAFFQGPLGRRMLAARRIYRELPFILGLPADRVYPLLAAGEGETVVVQGIVDCLLDEGDGLVLIDYKTDQARGEDREQVRSRYLGQLELYAQAVERIWRRPVRERYLYRFATGESIDCSPGGRPGG